MKAGTGVITVDYGRPSLKGRDMFAQLQEGTFWRVGRNEATVLTTPVDLAFGGTRVATGAYSLCLRRAVRASCGLQRPQTGQWGTQHDPAKDVASVTMTKSPLPAPVETFTMGLTPAPKGGVLELSWGATRLAASFEVGSREERPRRGLDTGGGRAVCRPCPKGWGDAQFDLSPPRSWLCSAVAFASDAPALRGVEAGDIDRSVEPCTDFYEFANGAWRAANPIPPSMARWSRRWAAGEAAKDQLKAILDEVSSSTKWPKGSVEQLIGDFYAACMDEARVDALGLEPVRPLLAEIDAMRTWPGRRADDRPPPRPRPSPCPSASWPSPDNHKPNDVIAEIYASGLGLPDRDYYVKPEPRFQEAREKYLAHVARDVRAGRVEPRGGRRRGRDASSHGEAAGRGLARQRGPARPARPPTTRRRFAEPAEAAPRLRLGGLLATRRSCPRATVNVQQPKFMTAVDQQLAETRRSPTGRPTCSGTLLRVRGAVALRRLRRRRASPSTAAYLGGREGDEAALEALRRVDRPPARRGAGPASTSRSTSRPRPRPACRSW